MKKSLFVLAMAASFSASAVEVNPNGTGQVLLYPFYTVKNNTTTSVHITNTTGQTKAVKVRFSEGKNTWEVLDFNLYLSPYDVWTGSILPDDNGGAKLITNDTSCTVPAIPSAGVSFRNALYSSGDIFGNGEPESDTSLARLQEGHLEVIEMGEVLNTTDFPAADYIEHTDGVPENCAELTEAWKNGEWVADRDANMSAPTGGLSGAGYLINVSQGYQVAYDAVAIDNFWNLSGAGNSAHNRPGTSFPDLNGQVEDNTGNIVKLGNTSSNVVANGGLVTSNWSETIDALSAVLMANTITNDYNVYAGTASETDWVISFPTKHFYVNGAESRNGLGPNRAPFTSSYEADDNDGACEPIGLIYFDAEERTTTTNTGSVDFSPSSPAPGPELCWETSRITFNNSNIFGSGDSLNNISVDYSGGWSRITFNQTMTSIDVPAHVYTGLPVIGFSATVAKNGTLNGGTVLANYGSSFEHKKTKKISP